MVPNKNIFELIHYDLKLLNHYIACIEFKNHYPEIDQGSNPSKSMNSLTWCQVSLLLHSDFREELMFSSFQMEG